MFELDISVHGTGASGLVVVANRTGGHVRYMLEQVTGSVQGGDFQIFYWNLFFHRALKIHLLLKISNNLH